MFNKITKTFNWGDQQVTLETGEIARQAQGAVVVTIGKTVVLATVVAEKKAKPGQNFFPLTIDYLEKSYANGKIPGGFFRREGRASENETLISRLIDRPLRPLFPKNFKNEVQIIVHVLSVEPEIATDIPALIGASAALCISGIPFKGPVAPARVGYKNGEFLLNPKRSELNQASQLDLVLAGTENGILMVESQAEQLSEELMLKALEFGHNQIKVAVAAINDFKNQVGESNKEGLFVYQPPETDHEAVIFEQVYALAAADITRAYQIREKQARSSTLEMIRQRVIDQLTQLSITADETANETSPASTLFNEVDVAEAIYHLEKKIVRQKLLEGEPRIDGRCTRTVRPIEIRTNVLPSTHGSVLFTRGETQALVVATLGGQNDEQIIDALEGEYRDRFFLHYNMPPFATGETGRVGSPKRREIGHGRLAKRALIPILPDQESCPYTIRLVSEITESNGSSSMASVCGGSLALMAAGINTKGHVAGVAMGLIQGDDRRFAVLTDILGDEDHLGDMDFKVAGTRTGITALQMDIKTDGIDSCILAAALEQAREGRLHILSEMEKALDSPYELATCAPRMETIQIRPEKIRDVIGKGGAVIRALSEETKASINISDKGVVTISCAESQGMADAKARILEICSDVEAGQIYKGTILKLIEHGAIVNVLPGKDGLLHISEIVSERVKNVGDHLKVGQQIDVKVIQVEGNGRFRLSAKALQQPVIAPQVSQQGA